MNQLNRIVLRIVAVIMADIWWGGDYGKNSCPCYERSVFVDIEEAMVFHNRDGVAMKTIMIAKTDSNRVGDNN